MARIALSDGYETIVDDDDLPIVGKVRWRLPRSDDIHFYACRKDGERTVLMHRVLMDAKPGELVDHRNGDGLDNRRLNLRVGTQSQNLGNRRKFGGTSRYKGVSWNSRERCWVAQLGRGARKYLGYYATEIDAATAYNAAAKAKWGEWALLNEVPDYMPVKLVRPRTGAPKKLSAQAILNIRRRLMDGELVSAVARSVGVTPSMVSHIKVGRAWGSLVGPVGWREWAEENR